MVALTQADAAVDDRPKNFLTEAEIASFLKAARRGRHGVRNSAMALVAFRHGLRVSELINMRMADLDLDTGHLFVRRLKGSLSTSQPLEGDEIRALRAWLRHRRNEPCCNSPLVFLSERGPMTRQAFNYTCESIGLEDWANRTYTDKFKNGLRKKRFGLSRATTILHFVSGGRYPIFDSRVKAAMARLLGQPKLPDTVASYLDSYLPLFNELAEQCETLDLRMLDKALFSYGALDKRTFLK